MNRKWCKWSFVALFAVVTVGIVGGSLQAGKPAPPPPPPPPTTVKYVIRWLPFVPAGINDLGDIVACDPGATPRAFVLPKGADPMLGRVYLNDTINPESGWDLQYASRINDLGQIVGKGLLNGVTRAYRYTPPAGDGYASVVDLGILEGCDQIWVKGINNLGEVCGYCRNALSNSTNAFFYSDLTGIVPIVVPGAVWSDAAGINDAGQVVGTFNNGAGVASYRWTPRDELETYLDPLNTSNKVVTNSRGFGINTKGDFCGLAWSSSVRAVRYYRYTAAGVKDVTGGGTSGTAIADDVGVNDHGDVVETVRLYATGSIYASTDLLYLYTDTTGTLRMNDLVKGANADADIAAWSSATAQISRRINNAGEIIGYAYYRDTGTDQGFLLTPVQP